MAESRTARAVARVREGRWTAAEASERDMTDKDWATPDPEPGGGDGDGANRARRLEERRARGELEAAGWAMDAPEAVWRARCTLHEELRNTGDAFPGVQAASAKDVRRQRHHPLRGAGADDGLLGMIFETSDGREWCVEEFATDAPGGRAGVYAYDTRKWASASLKLSDRCRYFSPAVWSGIQTERAARKAEADDFLARNGANMTGLDAVLRRPDSEERPADRRQPLGKITVGHAVHDGEGTDWVKVYVGGAEHHRAPGEVGDGRDGGQEPMGAARHAGRGDAWGGV